jgi:serine/threonine-protein phosphatase 6 regulatory ankyrin repeat subunit B
MASTSAATTKQQANLDIAEAAKSDDDAKAAAATSVATTNQEANLDLMEAAKSDGEAKPIAATLVATTNQEANLDLMEAAKSDAEAKPITATSVATTNEQANSDLREAAKSDDEAKAVAALRQSGVDVNCRENLRLRNTPLILAICFHKVKVTRVLLADPRVDVNAPDTLGLTALHRATVECLTAIIDSPRTDIDFNPTHKAGGTALLFKSRLVNVDTVSKLITVKSVQLLARSIDGFTALHELAEQESSFPAWFTALPTPERRCKLIDVLFPELKARGHDLVKFVNVTDVLDRTALHYIAEGGSVKMLKKLLEWCPTGMSVTDVDCHGFTPIHLAVRRGHTDMVELFLHVPSMDANIGATVNASSPSGLKPWESDHFDMCRPNLFLKAPKELPPAGNLTPLHFAAMDGHTEIVDLLLKWPGIHVAPLDTKGLSPFYYSIQNGHSGVVKLLLEKLKNVGEPFTFCDQWRAPLDHCIQKGHLEVVKLLVEEAKPFQLDNHEQQMSMFENLLSVATQHNKKEIAVQLLQILGLRTQAFAQTSTQSPSHESILLAVAASNNNFTIIRCVLKWHPEVEANALIELVAHQDLVAPPLHFAALGGHVEAVRELLKYQNLDVNAKDSEKRTPLHFAAMDGHTEIVDLLLKWPGIHVAPLDTKGLSPFHYSIQNGHLGVVKLLLEKLENVGEPFTFCDQWFAPLDHSIQKGHLEVVKLLVEEAKPFQLDNHEQQMSMFENLLSVATQHNKKEIAVQLLQILGLRTQAFAQTSTQSPSHESILLAVAASNNNFTIIRCVLKWHPEVEANALIDLVAHQDLVAPPLHFAAPPLHFAALGGHVEAVRELLKYQNLDVNAKDSEKRTPLHFAAMDGHTEIVDLLLKWPGIHVAPLDTKGLSPFHYSIQNGHLGVVKLLLEKLENVGEPFTFCDQWFAPLDHSIQKGHLEVVKLLVEEAKPFQLDNHEQQMSMFENLLSVATQHNKKEIEVQLLQILGSRTQAFAQTSTQSPSHESILLAVAASNNNFTIIRDVLKWHPEVEANASIELVPHQGLVAPPLHFAALGGHVEAVRELLKHQNLDVNAKDNKNMTPLLCAIRENKVEVVKTLCFDDPAKRLRATEEYKDGRTPIQIATEADCKEIKKVLLERPEVKDFVDRLYRDRQVFVDAANALLVGAALIASVTFAGWLQPPLGYIPDYEFSQPFPAPPQTPESYAAVKNHAIVKAFWVFNSLSFFFAIATVLAGADAVFPNLRDDFIQKQVESVEKALKRATILLVISVVCVLGAFASAGFAVLPPLLKYDTSMIITVCLGGTICMLTLAKIIWKLSTPIRMRYLKTWKPAGGHVTGLPE